MSRPKFSEATVLSVAKTALANARSTVTALSEFGITDESLNQFEGKINAAEALPGETLNRIELRAFTGSKDETLELCYSWGRKLDVRLEMAFGKGSTEAKSFPSKQFSEAERNENKMMTVLEVVIASLKKIKPHLLTLAKHRKLCNKAKICSVNYARATRYKSSRRIPNCLQPRNAIKSSLGFMTRSIKSTALAALSLKTTRSKECCLRVNGQPVKTRRLTQKRLNRTIYIIG